MEIAGGLYHIVARGNERTDVFHEVRDRDLYLKRIAVPIIKQSASTRNFELLPLVSQPLEVLLPIRSDARRPPGARCPNHDVLNNSWKLLPPRPSHRPDNSSIQD